MTDDLDALRSEIDALDREIVSLLNRRARLGLAAGKAKLQSGRPITDTDREREVMVRSRWPTKARFHRTRCWRCTVI